MRIATLVLMVSVLLVGCAEPPSHVDVRAPEEDLEGYVSLKGTAETAPLDVMDCGDFDPTRLVDGRARIRFARIFLPVTDVTCGRVTLAGDPSPFVPFLQKELAQQEGCSGCDVVRVQSIEVRDAVISMHGHVRDDERGSYFWGIADPRVPPGLREPLELVHASFRYANDGAIDAPLAQHPLGELGRNGFRSSPPDVFDD